MIKSQQELPQYILPQLKTRAIIPKIITLLFLGVIFYLGILLNISLLELNLTQQNITKIISVVLVILIIILGIALAIINSQRNYLLDNV